MRMSFRKISFVFFVGSLFALTGIVPGALAGPGQGVPFQALQAQIDALQEAVEQLSQQVGGGDKAELVECDQGDTIADALAGAGVARRVMLTITGLCNEAVTLTRDDVTLLGGSGTITGRITLDGARRIVIDGLTLLGGIGATRGATVNIRNSMIDVGSDPAIVVNHGGFAEIVNNPLIRSQESCAVQASDGGEVRLQGNPMIQSNQADPGICSTLGLFRQGLARLRGGNNFVNGGGGNVFDIIEGSILRQDGGFDSFQGNGNIIRTSNADIRSASFNGGRLRVGYNSSVRFRDSVLNSELAISNMSTVESNRNTVINGFVSIVENSNVLVRFSNTVNGNMFIGERSQAFLIGAEVNGNISCNTSGSPITPGLALQLSLVPGLPGPQDFVFTSGGEIAFAYRGAVVGAPSGTVTFDPTCN